MPNGHGGIPRYGSPVLLALVLAVLFWLGASRGADWTRSAALVVAGLFCWRLAWHRHLYPLMEYGGHHQPAETLAGAQRRYRRTLALSLPPVLVLVYALWP